MFLYSSSLTTTATATITTIIGIYPSSSSPRIPQSLSLDSSHAFVTHRKAAKSEDASPPFFFWTKSGLNEF